jgi:hypothetical protein
MMKCVRIGAGAGYAGDRWEPALEVVEKGNVDYIVFECLAERTIARETLAKLKDRNKGYNPWLERRMLHILPAAQQRGVKIITNMGAANPEAAAERIAEMADELGLGSIKVAAVLGDDVKEVIKGYDTRIMETGETLSSIEDQVIAANAYLGAESILQALREGADVIVTGRCADPSLFLAPILFELGWDLDDYEMIGQGTLVGHLMECAGQITGGYFADPGFKNVPDLAKLGFPIAEVYEDGTAYITKVEGTGGYVTEVTCKEQMLYEIHDPFNYVTPDCVLDLGEVCFKEIEKDRVQVIGGKGKPRTTTLKASINFHNGFIGEGQMSYAGPGAVERAKLAGDVVVERLKLRGVAYESIQVDLIGLNSIHSTARPPLEDPYEVRLRVAASTDNYEDAADIGHEVETLLTNGPYGGAGDFKQVREVIAVLSILLPRDMAKTEVVFKGA